MMNPFELCDRNILITGASSGIGRGIAVGCSKMNASLYISARNIDRLNQTVNIIGQGQAIAADLMVDQEIISLVDSLPELDGLVLCAGINKKEPVNYISVNGIDEILGTNFISNVKLIKQLLRKKKIRHGASIVFISSVSVDIPAKGNAIYAASKGAIDSYSRVLALELSKKRIRVNVIEPGMVKTEWLDKGISTDEQIAKDIDRYPLGRYGNPEDIANAVIYLLSEASCWMTGASLRIDGGLSLL